MFLHLNYQLAYSSGKNIFQTKPRKSVYLGLDNYKTKPTYAKFKI